MIQMRPFLSVSTHGAASSHVPPPSSRKVTHVVCGVDAEKNINRTLKYLLGLAHGCKIVTPDWLAASLRQGQLQPEELFLVRGSTKNPLSEGPKKSLVAHFYNFPPLFAGCHFYLDVEKRLFRQVCI